MTTEAEELFAKGRSALATGHTLDALVLVERALKSCDNRSWYSCLGYCIAKERGQVKKGIELCLLALESEPENPDHYLNLGNIHLVARNKTEALAAFRKGMSVGGNEEIAARLNKIGHRKPPLFPRLPRNHPLNRYLGFILYRLRLRRG